MKMQTLREIGRELFREINKLRPVRQEAISTGASGDKTFPVDKKAEDIIIKHLEATGEPLSIISEEAGMMDLNGGGRKVLIDPIDGSKNAISGIPFYCTSIAMAEGDIIGDTAMSYVINLINGDEFWAEKGKGAYLNGMRIYSQKDDIFYLIAYEAQNPGHDIKKALPLLSESRKTRCLGATALDLAYLASGSISVFINPSPSRSFDFAGGYLLVREAGGVFTDMEGNGIESVKAGLKKSTSLLASGNERLHEKALRLLKHE
jgi:myo-inositol-1(or 4)-monophosphatase